MTRSLKKEQPSDEEVLQAFRACNDLDEEKAVAMAPEIMAVALPDRFVIAPSIVLPNSIWAVLLHPGSVNSSGLILTVATALSTIMTKRHAAEKEMAKRKAQAQEAAGLEPDYDEPPRRQCLAGGGSLAATG
eukprot:s202_g18.t1